MPQKITETAQLQCDKGAIPTALIVTSQYFSIFDNKLIATEEDAKPNENIMPFGSCKLKYNMPCSPTTQKWNKTSKNDTINDLRIVLETSECLCTTGGKITILDTGHQGDIEAE